MKKNTTLVFIGIIMSIYAKAQNNITLFGNIDKYIEDTTYIPIDYNCIYYNNDKIKFIYYRKNKKTFISRNDLIVDSIDGYMGHHSFYNRKDTSIFLISNSNNTEYAINIYQLYLTNNKVKQIKKDFWGMVLGFNKGKLLITNKVIFSDTIIDELFYLDPDTKKTNKFFKLNSNITKYTGNYFNIYYQIYSVYSFPNSNNIAIEISEVDNNEADDPNYYFNYIYNTTDESLKIFQNFEYESFNLSTFDKNCNYSIINGYIFNNNYEYINKGLIPFKSSEEHYQIFKNKIVTYVSRTYYKNIYIYIPYRFVYELSSNMYKISEDSIINESDIKKMAQVDLKILKSMIYAKHGYIFESQYLTLYFGLYSLYKPSTTNKTAVEQKFTQTDKQNLALINKYIVKPDLSTYKPEEIQKAKQIVSYIDTLATHIINKDNENYDISYKKLKAFISNNKNVSKNKELIEQIYLQNGLNIFSSDVSTPYSVIHYRVRNSVNTLSAIYGYEFGNKQWLKIFKLFDWYKPNTKTPDFSPDIKNLTQNLSKFEKEFK